MIGLASIAEALGFIALIAGVVSLEYMEKPTLWLWILVAIWALTTDWK